MGQFFSNEAAPPAALGKDAKSPGVNMSAEHMESAVNIALKGLNRLEGGPFGCVIVKDGKIVGQGNNKVPSSNDPTAHAEIVAIREACKNLGSFQLDGCDVYTTCEPCPMCFGALYWSRPQAVYYSASRADAASYGFDDSFIYEQIPLCNKDKTIHFEQIEGDMSKNLFKKWAECDKKEKY